MTRGPASTFRTDPRCSIPSGRSPRGRVRAARRPLRSRRRSTGWTPRSRTERCYRPDMAEAPRLRVSTLAAVRLLRRDPLTLLERAASEGDVVRIRVPRLDLFVLNRPDLVWDVLATHGGRFTKGPTMQAARRMLGESLLTSEGDHHRRRRRLIQPLFHHERITALAPRIRAAGERAATRWHDGERIDVRAEMARVTLE